MSQKTLSALSSGLIDPDEQVIDGGPARCKRLDRMHLDMVERELGGIREVRRFAKANGVAPMQALEADWIATTKGLYYFSFHTTASSFWPWDRIRGAELQRRPLVGMTTVGVMFRDGTLGEFQLNRLAARAFQQVVSSHALAS